MTPDPAPPTVPTSQLDEGGWERTELSTETIFSLPTVQIRTATVQYADTAAAEALTETRGEEFDGLLRFFAASRLAFDPPLPPGVTPAAIGSMLRKEARRTFKKRLRERGLVDIERDGSQRLRVGNRRRAQVTKFAAAMPLSDGRLPLACWVAPWTTSDDALIVTGGHPQVGLAEFFGLETDDPRLTRSPSAYREEFFSLLRGVE
ncbi:hypothetical protein [Halovenus salina]|uniref:hypothetical protein n=1 Tax=Halovenus salina TaxID=1510225 RepID=UPI002260F9D8|nr:hypothetical protein [Halovenus salina]